MGKKDEFRTPNTRIRAALRMLWMRSRERQACIKKHSNTCQEKGCGKKGSVAVGREVKIEVHHLKEPNWERIFSVIREELLVPHTDMVPLCKECHAVITKAQKESLQEKENESTISSEREK